LNARLKTAYDSEPASNAISATLRLVVVPGV
jgi:hypothetical protein